MRRNILGIIVGLVLVLSVGAWGQLPIYEQWRQEYHIEANSISVVIPARTPINMEGFFASVQYYDRWYMGHGYYSYNVREYICHLDSSGIVWLRQIENYPRDGGIPGMPSNPLLLSDETIVVRNAQSEVMHYTLEGDSIGSFEILPDPWDHLSRGILLSTSRGFITASVLGVYSYTDSGVLLDSLVVPDLYSSFKDIEKISDNLFFVLCTPDSYTVTYVVDINLTVTQTDTVATGLFPVAVCNGSSGALFVTARNMLNDSLVLLRFSESGEFEYLRMFYDNQLLYIGSDFFSTTAGVLCVQVNRTNGLKHYQFYSEDLESLGTLTLHDDGHSSIADDDGGMLVSSWVGTHFFVTKFGTTPTPTNSTPALPNNIAVSVYPNPFNATTTFSFDLPGGTPVSLRIYDTTGLQVATVIDEFRDAGSYTTSFDASALASGVYFYRFDAWQFSHSGKLLLLK